jgi:flagellar protein FliS
MIATSRQNAASAYKRVHIETSVSGAAPHQLVCLLFDALLSNITRARGCLQRKDIAGKGHAIGLAVRILEEGLKAGLDARGGTEIVETLRTLYDCVIARLTTANMNNDDAMLGECSRLIEPVHAAWLSIAGTAAQAVDNSYQYQKLAA